MMTRLLSYQALVILKKGFYEVQVDKFTSVSFDKEAFIILK